MGEIKWSKEQEAVIRHRGSNLLVAAAAGSGKTAVLVERIVGLLMDPGHPVDIDHLLVVTFTNAAAAEMRERIQKRIEEKLLEHPEQEFLQRQLSLMNNAQISTIHSFCMNLIRNYFMEIEIDPSLRLADETELVLWKSDVMAQLLEEEYKEHGEEGSFHDFVENYSAGKSDEALGGIIQRVYDFSISFPYPEKWLDSCIKDYEQGEGEGEPGWLSFLCGDIKQTLVDLLSDLERAKQICKKQNGPAAYMETLLQDEEQIELLLACRRTDGTEGEEDRPLDYALLSEAFQNLKWARLKTVSKKQEVDVEAKEAVKEIRDQIKKAVKSMQEEFFFQDYAGMMEDIHKAVPMAGEIVRLTKRFTELYQKDKKERKVMDFNDLEHYALDILLKEEEGKMVPTAAALELRDYYEEIMIDEYQDSNLVQELILSSIAKQEGKTPVNLFMVGDVKQSIYRFRMARPELFMEKYNTYQNNAGKLEGEKGQPGSEQMEKRTVPLRIDLSKNFRSRPPVLKSVNFIFSQIMQKRLGGIVYDDAAALHLGNEFPAYPEPEEVVTECILVTGDLEDGEDAVEEIEFNENVLGQARESETERREASERELEARAVAGKIKELTEKKTLVQQGDSFRQVQYGDIVILLRTMSGWAEEFKEILVQEGIPAFTDTQSGYFSAREIQVMLNLLKIIDNPRQDIPLAAVLYSPVGGMNKEELARIRMADQEGSLFDALQLFVKEEEIEEGLVQGDCMKKEYPIKDPVSGNARKKAGRWLLELSAYREFAAFHTVSELLGFIYERSGYYDYVMALPSGDKRCANLTMLRRKAEAYGESHYSGLFHFNRYIEQLFRYEVDFGEAGFSENIRHAVKIMSIHKSKGLEFPVVIAAGLGKPFNRMDSRERVILSQDYGFGLDVMDYEKRTRFATLPKKAAQKKLELDMLAEELRVLYVALTRAKERLILTGFVKKPEKLRKQILRAEERKELEFGYQELTKAGCFLDYILPAVFFQKEQNVKMGEDTDRKQKILRKTGDFLVRAQDSMELTETGVENLLEKRERLDNLLHLGEKWPAEKAGDKGKPEQEKLLQYAGYRYPFGEEVTLKGKVTVSEIKKKRMEEALLKLSEEETVFFDPEAVENRGFPKAEAVKIEVGKPEEEIPLPKFLQEGKEDFTGAQRGSIYHKVMESISFTKEYSTAQVKEELSRLVAERKLTGAERDVICGQDILEFFTGQGKTLAKRMQKSAGNGTLYREQPFVMGEKAADLYPGAKSQELVLVQGVIDAYFEEEGEWVLVDYKTDHIKKGEDALLIKRYQTQLFYYKKALEQATGKKVRDCYLYAFALGRVIRVETGKV